MGFDHPILDEPPPSAGRAIAAVYFAACRDQRAHLRDLRRQAGSFFLQPRRQPSLRRLGSAHFLSPAVLARGHEGQRPWRTEDCILYQTRSRSEAGGTACVLWTCLAANPRLCRIARAFPYRALLSLLGQSQASLSRRYSSSALGTASGRRRLGTQHPGANCWHRTARNPRSRALFARSQGAGLGARATALARGPRRVAARSL